MVVGVAGRLFDMASLSIVIPAYNERSAIEGGRLVPVVTWCSRSDNPAELLVVNDGSDDGTEDALKAGGFRSVDISHGGKAAAIIAGIREASGERVLFTDMDQATPVGEADRLLDALDAGADIAIGSRGFSRPGAPPGRYIMSGGHSLLRRFILGMKWRDTQCGFKAFRRGVALEVISKMRIFGPSGWATSAGPAVTSGFDVEFLLVAGRMGFRISEVPVVWRYQETRRVGKVKDSWRGFRDLLAIARADRDGAYPPPIEREDPRI